MKELYFVIEDQNGIQYNCDKNLNRISKVDHDNCFYHEYDNCYLITIAECHFTINPKKTRLQKRGSRQEVTGLTVVQKANVSRKYIKNLRVLIHRIKCQEAPTIHDIHVVRGKLNFLRMVKGADDPTYIAYTKKLNMAVKGKHFA